MEILQSERELGLSVAVFRALCRRGAARLRRRRCIVAKVGRRLRRKSDRILERHQISIFDGRLELCKDLLGVIADARKLRSVVRRPIIERAGSTEKRSKERRHRCGVVAGNRAAERAHRHLLRRVVVMIGGIDRAGRSRVARHCYCSLTARRAELWRTPVVAGSSYCRDALVEFRPGS